jgi:hypothetical protein
MPLDMGASVAHPAVRQSSVIRDSDWVLEDNDHRVAAQEHLAYEAIFVDRLCLSLALRRRIAERVSLLETGTIDAHALIRAL